MAPGPQAANIRAAQADLLDALPGVRLSDLDELRACGVLGIHRVVLDVSGTRKADKSITIDYHAKLISKDEDNEVNDQTDGSRTIVSGAAETITFDMASDEFAGPRAHRVHGLEQLSTRQTRQG
ncbi:hypothetical protein AB5J72_51510 (plasmid) [Streptomyces sp. CG1]|uniref:hypothetical protein n=1 Tax=Streptomyces sp. CG1 TaxID=1287523 RepID=UPI0034E25F70